MCSKRFRETSLAQVQFDGVSVAENASIPALEFYADHFLIFEIGIFLEMDNPASIAFLADLLGDLNVAGL